MRYILASLLFLYTLAPTFAHAQLSWLKKTYGVRGTTVMRADINGDGFPDLLVYGGSATLVILNKGDGTFSTSPIFATNPLSSASFLDFNRDGNVDVAGCDGDGNFVILLGHGDGTLTLTQSIADGCSWVTAADFNHDGNPDVAVGAASANPDATNNQVIVYLGDGNGGISNQVVNSKVDFFSSDGDACIINGDGKAADFTGDNMADIVLTATCTPDIFNASALIVGKGDGTGHFTFHKDQDLQSDAGIQLRLGDLNLDGRRDLFGRFEQDFPFANGSTFIMAFISKGDGTFTPKQLLATNISESFGDTITAYEIADIDGDGIKDVVAAISTFTDNSGPDPTFSFRVYKGHSDGSYTSIQNSPLANTVSDMIWGISTKMVVPTWYWLVLSPPMYGLTKAPPPQFAEQPKICGPLPRLITAVQVDYFISWLLRVTAT